eukprot:7532791-Alexandrium_andersonii.AAC.1
MRRNGRLPRAAPDRAALTGPSSKVDPQRSAAFQSSSRASLGSESASRRRHWRQRSKGCRVAQTRVSGVQFEAICALGLTGAGWQTNRAAEQPSHLGVDSLETNR